MSFRLFGLSWLCALCFSASAAGEDVELRITWGGGQQKRLWRGELEISHGRVQHWRRLGLEADLPGSAWQVESGIRFQERSATSFDGFDVTLDAAPDSTLTVRISTDVNDTKTVNVPIADFLVDRHHVHLELLDESQNRLLVRRAPGDPVAVTIEGDRLVYAPQDELRFRVQPRQLGLEPNSSFRCSLEVVDGELRELWRQTVDPQADSRGVIEPLGPFTVPLPAAEGVYMLRVSISQRRFADALMPGKPLHTREVQLVVIDNQPRPLPAGESWREVARIDLGDPTWWKKWNWLPQLARRSAISRNPVGNAPLDELVHRDQRFLQLKPEAWHAVPIPVENVGRPHVLEVEFPNDIPQTLGITILEPNAAGVVAPLFLDSGIEVADHPQAEQFEIGRHRLTFWPRTKTPWLLLTNRRAADAAVFGGVRVLAGPSRLPASGSIAPRLPSTADTRLLALYYDKPLFPQNFTAVESLEPSTNPQRSLNDWNTFYVGGERLIEYLNHVGYNAAVVSVFRDGSTLYPSRLVEPTPRHDNGAFFVTGQDPVQKDVLEMMFRQFDRANLKLIPALHFASPLPALEKQLRGGEESRGIELQNGRGRSYVSHFGSRRGLAPYYNPLDDRVQRAIGDVVAELVARYSHHRSFGGVTLQLSPESYAQLPDVQWGQDTRTWSRFRQAAAQAGYSVAAPISGDTRLSDDVGNAWLEWRASIMAAFYQGLGNLVTRRRPDAKFYLAMAESASGEPVQEAMRPRLPRESNFQQAMLRYGIDAGKLSDAENVVMLRPRLVSPLLDLPGQAADFELNRSVEVDKYFQAAAAHGALNFHQPLNLRLPEFDAASPFGAERTTTWLSAHISPAGSLSRAHFTNSLAAGDMLSIIDGGWMVPLGQEEALRPLLTTYRRLPARPFQTVPRITHRDLASPVTVRTATDKAGTYYYLVNNGPWSVDVTLDIDVPIQCRIEPLDQGSQPTLTDAGPHRQWQTTVAPYGLRAGLFVGHDARVLDWRVAFPQTAQTAMKAMLSEVNLRRTELRNPQPLTVLQNPGFEQPTRDGVIPGWKSSQLPGVQAAVRSDAESGRRALHLAVTEAQTKGWIRSDEFPLPATGRISILAFIRNADPTRQPALRMAVDILSPGKRSQYIPAQLGRGGTAALPDSWPEEGFMFHIPNLPVAGPASVTLVFEMIGQGEVWIDDIRVYDLFFDEPELRALDRSYAAASHYFDKQMLAECQQYLDGYWPHYLLRFVEPPAIPRVARQPAASTVANPAQLPPAQEQKKRPSWGRFVPQLPLPSFRR